VSTSTRWQFAFSALLS